MATIQFEGKSIEVPDDATDSEISSILDQMSAPTQKQPANVAKSPSVTAQAAIMANEGVGSVIEPLLKMGTGMLAYPVSGIAGLAATASDAIKGESNDPSGFKKYVQEKLTYQPRTELGASEYNPLNAIPDAIGSALGYVGGGAGNLAGQGVEALGGGNVQDASSLAGLTKNFVTEAVPQAIGIATMSKAPQAGLKADAVMAKRIQALKDQKALDVVRNDIRSKGQELGLIAPASGSVKRNISKLGNADQHISLKNMETATNVLAEEVGLKRGAISDLDISTRIGELSKDYRNIETAFGKNAALKVTPDFVQSIDQMLVPMKQKLAHDPVAFGGLNEAVNLLESQKALSTVPMNAIMEKIRTLRSDARSYDKNPSSTPAQQNLAKTNYEIATAYENMLENALASTKPALLNKFRDSRKQLAQLHVLDSARTVDGLIDLNRLGTEIGRYGASKSFTTGKLKSIVDFANTFKDVTRPIIREKLPTATRWEMASGLVGVGAAAAGAPVALAMALPAAGRAASPVMGTRGMLQGKTPTYQLSGMQSIEPSLVRGGMFGAGVSPFITDREQQ